MRKQVLLVETDEQTRIAVESALRQDGFEVVSVDSASRAEGILSVSSFDAALIGAGIRDDNGPYAVNWLGSDERSSTPFSVLCPQEVMIPELPEELVVRCPFAPEVIQRKVRELTGEQTAAVSAQDPAQAGGEEFFGGPGVKEDFLDQALGLDQLEVNESETMDAGDTTQVGPRKVSESLVGYEADVTNISSTQHTITDAGQISMEAPKKSNSDSQEGAPPQKEVELATDHGQDSTPPRTGQPAPNAPAPSQAQERHDYNWFISEMQGQQGGGAPPRGEGDSLSPVSQSPADQTADRQSPVRQNAEEFARMVKMDISAENKTGSKTSKTKKASRPARPVQSDQPALPARQAAEEGVFDWHDAPTDGPEGSVGEVFSRHMAEAVAKEVAEKLFKQLNSDKFTRLVESEIKKYIKKHS